RPVPPPAWAAVRPRRREAGGPAGVAHTRGGRAGALGAGDGDRLDRDRALEAVGRIVATVRVPVSADIESGYAEDPEGVADTVRAVLAAGAVGVNIEDALYGTEGGPLRSVAGQVERIAAARAAADAAGVPLFVNARIDTFLRAAGGVDATLERAAAFRAAGADGIFVPGVVDPETVKALVEGVGLPLNVLVGPGAPAVAELAALGVARVSAGSGLAEAAHASVRRAARELLDAGTYGALAGGIGYGELNTLLARKN
ncbi:isocitrate lyase/phosphoenolpyruvate mutase family protein, partial [Streptomyces sp. NPDC059627]